MATPITLVERINPAKPHLPRRLHASPLVTGEMSFDELVEALSPLSRQKPLDVKMALWALSEVVPKAVLKGQIVRLGELGTMRLQINDRGCNSIEEFDPSQIRRKRIQFNAGILVHHALNNAEVMLPD